MSDNYSEPPFAPRRVAGSPDRLLDIDGRLFPWHNDSPVLMQLNGTDDLFLPIFSTEQKLRETVAQNAIEITGIKRIDDGAEFLSSIPTHMGGQRLRIMVDPRRDEAENKTRFTEVVRGTEPV